MTQSFEDPPSPTQYQELSDQALADKVREGDDTAFTELWGRHGPVARRGSTVEDAQDNEQEVALKLWLHLRNGKESPADAVPYIRSMAVNNMVDTHRKRQRRPAEWLMGEYSEGLTALSAGPSPEDEVVGNITVEELLSRMTPGQREAVQATVIDGWRQREYAEEADIPIGTVKSRVHHGITKIRNRLTDGESSAI